MRHPIYVIAHRLQHLWHSSPLSTFTYNTNTSSCNNIRPLMNAFYCLSCL